MSSVKKYEKQCAVITRLILIVISPLLTVIILNLSDPSRFGGTLNISKIMFMYLFGLAMPAIWPTFIPTVIFTPVIMNKISKKKQFDEINIFQLILLSALIGAFCGILIFLPAYIFVIVENSRNEISFNSILSGAVSGAISLPLITLLYKWRKIVTIKVD